ncbi:MAG: hypothetical protein AAF572_27420 [Cyanobacteria bacterium P01_B01_bin.77]
MSLLAHIAVLIFSALLVVITALIAVIGGVAVNRIDFGALEEKFNKNTAPYFYPLLALLCAVFTILITDIPDLSPTYQPIRELTTPKPVFIHIEAPVIEKPISEAQKESELEPTLNQDIDQERESLSKEEKIKEFIINVQEWPEAIGAVINEDYPGITSSIEKAIHGIESFLIFALRAFIWVSKAFIVGIIVLFCLMPLSALRQSDTLAPYIFACTGVLSGVGLYWSSLLISLDPHPSIVNTVNNWLSSIST